MRKPWQFALIFAAGFALAWTAQNGRYRAQLADLRETHHAVIAASQNAENRAVKEVAQATQRLADTTGDTDHATADRIRSLLALNVELSRLRDSADAERRRCLAAHPTTASERAPAPATAGVPPDLSGVSAAADADLTRVYALEADVLRAKLDACVRLYEGAQEVVNGVQKTHNLQKSNS